MIKVTETAKEKIKGHLKSRGKGLGIRLGIKTTGCNGYAYTLEFVDEVDSMDETHDFNDFLIVLDKKATLFFEDVTLDYVKNGLNEGFEFINPKEKSRCGCGESFEI